ncbi:MAG TPA: uroporphyrinogen-III C-methyltransferase [Bryobacteraceae bacterium]|jgi:uroporphyrin-III C-methyltransferase|nr:uroporphyrinogen-III C-methyltransferase [Bryobacteraceae bacterium]
MTVAQKGIVYLVGAGPGDPELLTRKAAALLETADVVYHDDLVSEDVLALAAGHALVVSVGKRCGARRVTQAEINQKLVESARRDLAVVRLKSGDPLIFGRAGEEIAALRSAGIPYEVVPGISSAMAAAAAFGASLTSRDAASSVLLVTGHHADKPNAEFPPTRIVYMPGSNLAAIAEQWLAQGVTPDTPCVIVSRVSRPDQAIVRTTVGELRDAKAPESPAILLAGWALQNEKCATLFRSHSDSETEPRTSVSGL